MKRTLLSTAVAALVLGTTMIAPAYAQHDQHAAAAHGAAEHLIENSHVRTP